MRGSVGIVRVGETILWYEAGVCEGCRTAVAPDMVVVTR